MDRDRKSGPLKALQGRIWEQGYATGALKGEVYPDVAMRSCAGQQRAPESPSSRRAVSSPRNCCSRILRLVICPRFLSAYFDTGVGAKGEAGSYRRIAEAVAVTPSRVLFISDVTKELDAAREAGMQTLLCVRPPAQSPASSTHRIIEDFGCIAR